MRSRQLDNALVSARYLHPADVVVSALGVNDVTSQRGASAFVRDYLELLSTVVRRTGARGFVLCGLPPMQLLPAAAQPLRWYLGQCSTRLNVALRRFCDEHENSRFISIDWASPDDMAHDSFHPGKKLYYEWAQRVAHEIIALNTQRGMVKDA
ncbi:MAG: GDSL-type esterase/lipase family protein [Burkholderiaceae bacterium]